MAESFFWEPSRGWFLDFVFGRPLLFEARAPATLEGHRDIYRAFARLSYEGHLLDLDRVRNLTITRSADEYGIRGSSSIALFATRGMGTKASVSFLNLKGENKKPQLSLFQAWQLGVTRYLESGAWNGLGRSDLFLSADEEHASLKVVLTKNRVRILAGDEDLSLSTASLFLSPEPEALATAALSLVAREREPISFLHFSANTGRRLLGPGAVAWAEGRAFSLWDDYHQATHSLTRGKKTALPRRLSIDDSAKRDSSARSPHQSPLWPPKDLDVGQSTLPTDGNWRAVRRKLLPDTKEALFYQTVLHPDAKRPYAELHLVAIDMRRLRLGIGAGYEDPHPDTGPPGSGHLPLDEELAPRVVATFNGAFKAVHGRYGMKAEGRVLVEPVVGAATVAIDARGRTGFGSWTNELSTSEFQALRQNLDPLVAQRQVNPSGRSVWGEHLYGSGVAVERSALCLHESGQILYGWATEATGSSLAMGMQKAGCVYAIHLDMNPGHCAFLFNRVDSVKPLKAFGETLDPRMAVNPTRFIRWSPKDFFYLSLRDDAPKSQEIEWKASSGPGPEPQSIPAIFHGSTQVGDLTISLDRVNVGRLSYSVLPGTSESKTDKRTVGQSQNEIQTALIAWGLGHRTRGQRTGLSDGVEVVSPLLRSYASLVLEKERVQLLPPGTPITPQKTTQVVQLPVLAQDGSLTAEAKELGGKRERSALCIDPAGNLYVARMLHDTPAPVAQSLINLGCQLVVEMDRGSHPPPLVQRAGSDEAPREGQQQSLLYGQALAMTPQTYSF